MSFSDTAISIAYVLGIFLAVIYATWMVDSILSRSALSKSSNINRGLVAIIVVLLFLGGAASATLLPVGVQAQMLNIPLLPEVYRMWMKDGLAKRDPAVILRYCATSTAQPALASVLSRQGERAVTLLLKALSGDDGGARACARRTLSEPRMASAAKDSIPALTDSLEHASPEALQDILPVLAAQGENAAPAVPKLIPLLDSNSAQLRIAVERTLGVIGKGAMSAASALINRFDEAKDEEEKIELAVAITLIGPHDESARPAIQYALQKRGFRSDINDRGNRWLRQMH